MTNIDINGTLEKRGLLQACTDMGWGQSPLITCKKDDEGKPIKGEYITHESLPGWQYPIFNVMGQPHSTTNLRWRSAGTGKPKFAWQRDGQPDTVRYYFHPLLKNAIERHTDNLIIACGDMDVLTFIAAGKENCLTWFGEEAVPKTLGDDLQKLGVKKAMMYPDRDEAGYRGAATTAHLLSTVGIEFTCYQLPYEMGSKRDTNDLWIQAEFKKMAFNRLLRECPIISPEELKKHERPSKAKAPTKGARPAPDVLHEDIWDLYRSEVKKALGTPLVHQGGHDYFHCPLPSHTDKDPSFRISDDAVPGGWPVCSCGIQNDSDAWQQVGEALDLKWPEFLAQKKAEMKPKPAPTKPTLPPKPEEKKLPDEVKKPVAQAPTIRKPVDIMDRFETRKGSLQKLSRQLAGEELIEHEPIEFPLTVLHRFGGFAKLMRIGKMVYTLGASGSGKTSLLETIMEIFLRMGYDIIVFSPEWSGLDFASRTVHRNRKAKTLTFEQIDLHLLRTWEAAQDIPAEKRLGVNGGDKVLETRHLIRELSEWPGEAHFLKKHSGDTFEQLLDLTGEYIQKLRDEKRRVPLVFWDYLERFPKNGKSSGTAWAEMVAEELKTRSADWSIISWLFAQPRKDDAADAWQGEALQAGSARFLTEEQTNLYLTIGQKVDEFGNLVPNVGTINVVKNSLGAKSISINPETQQPYGQQDVFTDFERLAWVDEAAVTRKVNLNGYHGELGE